MNRINGIGEKSALTVWDGMHRISGIEQKAADVGTTAWPAVPPLPSLQSCQSRPKLSRLLSASLRLCGEVCSEVAA